LTYGKGAKERMLQIGNPEVLTALLLYQESFKEDISFSTASSTSYLTNQSVS
jgi:hypothetical protein